MRAYELLPEGAGDRERFFANLALGTTLIASGSGGEGADRLREATAILDASDVLSGDPRLLSSAALGPLWLREREVGAALVARAVELARASRALGALPFALMLSARHAAAADRWKHGRALYLEAIRAARETGQNTGALRRRSPASR